MIAKPPKLTEQQFLNGATAGGRATNGGNGGNGGEFKCTVRLPEDLAGWLKQEAWNRRVSLNAFLVKILTEKREEG